ncbi:hypothetical protein JCM33374_g2247 [Metschnikowia sp. JCM 33374]|nr:hypothetical protein JCM33374_g2247 [Metschnikowia sp. JCM 33374]
MKPNELLLGSGGYPQVTTVNHVDARRSDYARGRCVSSAPDGVPQSVGPVFIDSGPIWRGGTSSAAFWSAHHNVYCACVSGSGALRALDVHLLQGDICGRRFAARFPRVGPGPPRANGASGPVCLSRKRSTKPTQPTKRWTKRWMPSHVPNDGPLALDQSNPAEDCEGSPLAPNAGSRYPPSEFLVSHSFRNNEPAYRWCGTCMVWKPDRCHHCSTCRKCFLRMDHHCPWFACCIGFKNHKFFIQSLLYITAFSGAVCGASSFLLYTFFADAQYDHGVYLSLNLVFLFVVSVAFFCAVGCFAAFSVYLVLRNYTTIEFQDEKWSGSERNQYEYDAAGQRKNLRHLYDLGYAKNWRSIMGSSWLHWLLPVSVTDSSSVYSATNGLNFDVQEDVFQKYCYNARLQAQLNAQLAEYRDSGGDIYTSTWTGSYTTTITVTGTNGVKTHVFLVPGNALSTSTSTGSFTTTMILGGDGSYTPVVDIPRIRFKTPVWTGPSIVRKSLQQTLVQDFDYANPQSPEIPRGSSPAVLAVVKNFCLCEESTSWFSSSILMSARCFGHSETISGSHPKRLTCKLDIEKGADLILMDLLSPMLFAKNFMKNNARSLRQEDTPVGLGDSA